MEGALEDSLSGLKEEVSWSAVMVMDDEDADEEDDEDEDEEGVAEPEPRWLVWGGRECEDCPSMAARSEKGFLDPVLKSECGCSFWALRTSLAKRVCL